MIMIARESRMLGSSSTDVALLSSALRARGTRRLEDRNFTLGVGGTAGINADGSETRGEQDDRKIVES